MSLGIIGNTLLGLSTERNHLYMRTILPRESHSSLSKPTSMNRFYPCMPILTHYKVVQENRQTMREKRREVSLKDFVMQMKMMHLFLSGLEQQ